MLIHQIQLKIAHISIALPFLLALTACSFSLAGDVTPPPGYRPGADSLPQAEEISGPVYPLVPPDPSAGEAIYIEKCAPCHGLSGKGDGPRASQLPNPVAPVGTIELARQSKPVDWYDIVTQGNLEKFMPGFTSLSERQRWDVIAYVYSLSMPGDFIEQGRTSYQKNCTRCHGDNGEGDGPDAIGFSASMPNFTSQSFMSEKAIADLYDSISNEKSSDMPAYADLLSAQERWGLAYYLRTLTFALSTEQASAKSTPVKSEMPTSEMSVVQETPASAEGTPVAVLPGSASSKAKGVIAGQVTNGSGGELAEAMRVTLHGFDETQIAITNTVSLEPDGTFLFEGIDMPVGRSFLATTEYHNAIFGSNTVTIDENTGDVRLNITVYETTTDVSLLTVDRLHIFFDFSRPGTVQVIYVYIISNMSGKMVVSGEQGGPVATFSLPKGITNLQFQSGELGERFIQNPDGFADTVAIPPGMGKYQVMFGFEMPYQRELEFSQPINFPVDAVVVLLPEDGVRIRSDMLQDDGRRDFQGTNYRIYSASNLATGSQLKIDLAGKPGGGLSITTDLRFGLVIGLGAFGLTLVVVGLLLYRRNMVVEDGRGKKAVRPAEHPNLTKESLMDAIIALDDLYKEGKLPEDAYRQRRAQLKAQLKEWIE
jgi:mono/diheme cytochrome c family protein